MEWNDDLDALVATLARLYPREESSYRIVADAGMDHGLVAFQSAAKDNWYGILEYAVGCEQLDRLLDVVCKEFPLHDELHMVRRRLAAAAPKTDAQPKRDSAEPLPMEPPNLLIRAPGLGTMLNSLVAVRSKRYLLVLVVFLWALLAVGSSRYAYTDCVLAELLNDQGKRLAQIPFGYWGEPGAGTWSTIGIPVLFFLGLRFLDVASPVLAQLGVRRLMPLDARGAPARRTRGDVAAWIARRDYAWRFTYAGAFLVVVALSGWGIWHRSQLPRLDWASWTAIGPARGRVDAARTARAVGVRGVCNDTARPCRVVVRSDPGRDRERGPVVAFLVVAGSLNIALFGFIGWLTAKCLFVLTLLNGAILKGTTTSARPARTPGAAAARTNVALRFELDDPAGRLGMKPLDLVYKALLDFILGMAVWYILLKLANQRRDPSLIFHRDFSLFTSLDITLLFLMAWLLLLAMTIHLVLADQSAEALVLHQAQRLEAQVGAARGPRLESVLRRIDAISGQVASPWHIPGFRRRLAAVLFILTVVTAVMNIFPDTPIIRSFVDRTTKGFYDAVCPFDGTAS